MSYHNSHASSFPYVPKKNGNGRIKFTHKFDAASTALIEEIGGLPALERTKTHFCNNTFLDDTLDKFIGSYDDPHADRFARWIHQKLTGTGRIFSLEGINGILPHLYPFLLVDKVVENKQGKRAVGIKAVTAKEAHFTGHFPDRPIMHGVLQPSCVQG